MQKLAYLEENFNKGLEIPRIFLISHERAEFFPHFSQGIQNQEKASLSAS